MPTGDEELTIGVDLGTGSIKGVLVTSGGTVLASATRRHSLKRPHPGWFEMDAEQWWKDVARILSQLTTAALGRKIHGVAISGLGPCLVLTDSHFRPLRPAILYGIDTRATAEIEEMTTRLGAENILQRAGKDLSSQAIGPKLEWVRKNEPSIWKDTVFWFSAHNYIVARLTGKWTVDHHTASQSDPLYDVNEQDWAHDWAAELFPELDFPKLAWPDEVVGTVTSAARAVTGLETGIPVVAGTIDAWAEAFSVGVRKPGDLMVMYGSTMFIIQVLPAPAAHSGLWTTAGVEKDSFTIAAGMATSGIITTWLQELAGDPPFQELVDGDSTVPPGADGLLMLPYFAGERSPIFDADARGMILGLTVSHERRHLMRATYEGIAFGLRQNLEMLQEAVGPPTRILAVGGGTSGGLWPQIVSDICQTTQLIPRVTIGASYGDALLAAIGVGLVPPDTDWTEISGAITPDENNAEIYNELFETYQGLDPANREAMHSLAAIQRKTPVTSTLPRQQG